MLKYKTGGNIYEPKHYQGERGAIPKLSDLYGEEQTNHSKISAGYPEISAICRQWGGELTKELLVQYKEYLEQNGHYKAVSYTHLDVYKRQRQQRKETIMHR